MKLPRFSFGRGGRHVAAPIGVEFAAERLNMVQLEFGAGTPGMRAAVSTPYPVPRAQLMDDARALRGFVKSCLAQAPFSGRRVYCALPPADVRILPMTVHVAAGQREDQAVARAVRDQIGMDPSDAVVDYYHIRSADSDASERQVLVAVAQQKRVLAFLNVLTDAGLDPVALDIGPAAMARLLASMQREDLGQSVLLINFGLQKSFLTVIWGRRLMLDREIDFGEAQLVGKLSASLGLDADAALGLLRTHGVGARPAQRGGAAGEPDVGRTIREILYPEFAGLAEELLRTQVYVASRTRGSSLNRIYLNGSLARYPHIQTRIGELVALPVELLDPLSGFTGRAGSTLPSAEHGVALAAGLALRGEPRG
jgi:type IV pilus assembly protein PilM